MTPTQLKDQFRLDVDDAEFPGSGDDSESLWSDAEIFAFMDEAQKAFLQDVDVLASKITIPLWESEYEVAIPSNITKIRRMKHGSNPVTTSDLIDFEDGYRHSDYGVPSQFSWETVTGNPKTIITDAEEDTGYVVPHLPAINTTDDITTTTTLSSNASISDTNLVVTDSSKLHNPSSYGNYDIRIGDKDSYEVVTVSAIVDATNITVSALTADHTAGTKLLETASNYLTAWVYTISDDITSSSTSFSVSDVRYHRCFLNYMKYLAYMKQDADTYDKELSDKFYGRFGYDTARFKRELLRSRHTSGSIQYRDV